jgi:hypothetical protein
LALKEAFVPLTHPSGHAQADFGYAWAIVDGQKRKALLFGRGSAAE